MRNSGVALNIDMKITALSGTSIDGNPVLNNRAYSGVITLKQGEGVVLISEAGQAGEPRHQRSSGPQRDTGPERS